MRRLSLLFELCSLFNPHWSRTSFDRASGQTASLLMLKARIRILTLLDALGFANNFCLRHYVAGTSKHWICRDQPTTSHQDAASCAFLNAQSDSSHHSSVQNNQGPIVTIDMCQPSGSTSKITSCPISAQHRISVNDVVSRSRQCTVSYTCRSGILPTSRLPKSSVWL